MSTDILIAPATIKSGPPIEVGKKPPISRRETCLLCGNRNTNGKIYCSHQCSSKHRAQTNPRATEALARHNAAKTERVKQRIANGGSVYVMEAITCAWCGGSSSRIKGHDKRFCSPRCSARWRHTQPQMFVNALKGLEKARLKGLPKKSPEERARMSKRMKDNNPTRLPGVIEKMSAKLRGRTFLSRGGNGQLTQPQITLATALGAPMEYVIGVPTWVADHHQSPPRHYKVDLAIPELKLAIEVDGRSHKTKKWKFLDRRKEAILKLLGWTVIRFWNQEVIQNCSECVERTHSMILKLRERTATSQTIP